MICNYVEIGGNKKINMSTTMNPIDEYINNHDPAYRDNLCAVRDTIREQLPFAEEKISWSMPTWWKVHNIIHFAAAKKHIGIYPGPEAVDCFRNPAVHVRCFL